MDYKTARRLSVKCVRACVRACVCVCARVRACDVCVHVRVRVGVCVCVDDAMIFTPARSLSCTVLPTLSLCIPSHPLLLCRVLRSVPGSPIAAQCPALPPPVSHVVVCARSPLCGPALCATCSCAVRIVLCPHMPWGGGKLAFVRGGGGGGGSRPFSRPPPFRASVTGRGGEGGS